MRGYIYQIINKIDGRRYIGQTIDLNKRKQTHFSKLKQGTHPNNLLQNAWNEWGEENFIFVYEEFEEVTPDFLNKKEIETIAKYNSFYDGYNRTAGGQGGIIRRKLTYEDYCFIYYGCQWQGLTEKIARYLQIDSSTVSSILREVAHLDYLNKSKELSQQQIEQIQLSFRQAFNIPLDKEPDEQRVPTHLTEDEYFYCFCVCSTYSRGIEAALGKYFQKHKTFLSNGLKSGKKGIIKRAHDRFLALSVDECMNIGEQKFIEWQIDKFSKQNIKKSLNNKWRQ